MTKILILACSATKRADPGLLPAVERYDGPAYRTLARCRCFGIAPRLGAVLVLSAEHGLVAGETPIADYDRRLDQARAAELVDQVAAALLLRANAGRLEGEIFAFGGRLYRELLEAAVARLEPGFPIQFAAGGIGQQLGQLKAFLTAP